MARLALCGHLLDARRFEGRAGQRGDLARHAEHREAVGTVRRDLDVEHLIIEAELFHDVGADGGVAVEEQQARLVLLAETELTLGAEHPLRFEAVDLLGRHGTEAWQRRAGGREGRPDPGARVGGAAHNAEPLRAAATHTAQVEPMAAALAELPLDGLDLADDHAPQALGQQRRDARHLDAGVHETVGGALGGELHVHELPHPAVRDLHAN